MAANPRDQALSLLAAANNHGDLAVKLSSLKQIRDILHSMEPSLAAEFFPYLVDLQSSREILFRKSLIQVIEEVGLKVMESCSLLVPVLLAFLRDAEATVVQQSIISGTKMFGRVLEELAVQFLMRGKVEWWLEELWTSMIRFKDTIIMIALEPGGSVGGKVLALKFLEIFVLRFTSDNTDTVKTTIEGGTFNVSWLVGGHPILDPVIFMSEANRILGILLDLLRAAFNLPGALTITVINSLAAIARKRPLHYNAVLSALLDFNPNLEKPKGCHSTSIQYSIRTAFLGFLRCTHRTITESREKLLRALRGMNAGDAADQVIRQVDKMIKSNERALRENRLSRDDQLSSQLPGSGDVLKKRYFPQDVDNPPNGLEVASKRVRYSPNTNTPSSLQSSDSGHDSVSANGVSANPRLDSDLTPVEQMIIMIGALLAEGERGAESLKILIDQIHPDLLADIVITNMKHFPRKHPPLANLGSLPSTQPIDSVNGPAGFVAPSPTSHVQSPVLPGHFSCSSSSSISSVLSDIGTINSFATDSKRDPRRDPRRLDPRRSNTATVLASVPVVEDTIAIPSDVNGFNALNRSVLLPVAAAFEDAPGLPISNVESDQILADRVNPDMKEEVLADYEVSALPEVKASSDQQPSPLNMFDKDSTEMKLSDVEMIYEADTFSYFEPELHSPSVSNTTASEETCQELPSLPLYVDMTEEQQNRVENSAVERIIDSYKHLQGVDSSQMRMPLLARLVAQIDADDGMFRMLQEHVLVGYQQQKGHELVLHVLYHLHSFMTPNSDENSAHVAATYEKFLLTVAKSLLDTLPTSDKSFSRLLGEAPVLSDSVLKLLDDLCYSDIYDLNGKEVRDGERVTQGLGAVWSLILGRPNNRKACLGIALKCAVHSQEDIRAKAIRLVANKLHHLSYISGYIEQFATDMLLSAVNQEEIEIRQLGSDDQTAEGKVVSVETSTDQVSHPRTSESESDRISQPATNSVSTMSFSEAQRLISLFFALCTKKHSLLQLVFDVYGQAPKIVKQAFHRHIPILIRALGSSYTELFRIISDPPKGSENLLTFVLQILTQETIPSPDLIATVKHLYETKLKDVTILIPMLSSLSKNEVLPIFPRLVNLPLEKFQMALAHILQGSAHTGPALTPVEVLVAIHAIVPEKDGLPLKKITDACSACFEQRTVFTQQVLAKALNQMVDQTPLPLLFMRTVIQAIDAFPKLVDFVMEILSKLINRQIWRLPKFWVGFMKCVSQTLPHSFPVLLKLPVPQLESALNKYANLKGPLAAYSNQPTIKASLPRPTLVLLGISNESNMQQQMSSLHPSDTSSSVHGATST